MACLCALSSLAAALSGLLDEDEGGGIMAPTLQPPPPRAVCLPTCFYHSAPIVPHFLIGGTRVRRLTQLQRNVYKNYGHFLRFQSSIPVVF